MSFIFSPNSFHSSDVCRFVSGRYHNLPVFLIYIIIYFHISNDGYGLFTDAAKRRQLPAWIREGLEKMEREKQKKIDRERQMKEREAFLQKKREEEENAMNEFEINSDQPVIPKKSKFVSTISLFGMINFNCDNPLFNLAFYSILEFKFVTCYYTSIMNRR